MRFILPLLVLIFAELVVAGEQAGVTTVTLGTAVTRVKEQNLMLREDAVRVYQAKKSIDQARLSLIPGLNVWKILRIAVEPQAILSPDVIQDIAPFLIPANWFRAKETEHLYEAQKSAYHALWANEILNTKGLYIKVLVDQQLISELELESEELGRLTELARMRELLGFEKPGFAQALELRGLSLQQDLRQLQNLLRKERLELGRVLAITATENFVLAPVEFPAPSEAAPLVYRDLEPGVISKSPELKNYDALLRALPLIKKEIYFSFLGGSSLSRGTAGGVFDHLPSDSQLGLSTIASVKIVKSEIQAVTLQRRGAEESLKRQLVDAVEDANMTIAAASDARRRLGVAQSQVDAFRDRVRFGGVVELESYADALRERAWARLALTDLKAQNFLARDRVSRMTFIGDFEGSPATFQLPPK